MIHVITGEYPPQPGGVGDFSSQVSTGLAAAGATVHVWTPGRSESEIAGERLTIHRDAGTWGLPDLRRIGRQLDACPAPRRLLVQWVPHAFGWRTMNVPICKWLHARAGTGDVLEVIVHEPFFAFHEGSWRQDAAAAVHRMMVGLLLGRARRVWLTIPAWSDRVRPFVAAGASLEWLPVPSNVPVVHDSAGIEALRATLGSPVVGHFGTYGPSIASLLRDTLAGLAIARPDARFLLLGRGSRTFASETEAAKPELHGRLMAAGGLEPCVLSRHLQVCDVMVQPYPDGVTARRGSTMAALAHGRPVATTDGHLTEGLWRTSGAVALAPSADAGALIREVMRLLEDEDGRLALGSRGRHLYRQRFDISHTIAALMAAVG